MRLEWKNLEKITAVNIIDNVVHLKEVKEVQSTAWGKLFRTLIIH